MRTDSLDVSSLVSYINDIKPFHSKLTDVVVEYQANDNLFVSISDSSKMEMKFSSVWELHAVSDGKRVQYRIPAAVFPRYSDDFHQCKRIGVTDEVPGAPGSYFVPYNNGVEVSVNGVRKLLNSDYTIDPDRTVVKFLANAPKLGDEVCLNWAVTDRVFIAVNGEWQTYDLVYSGVADGLEMFPYDASDFDSDAAEFAELAGLQKIVKLNPIGVVKVIADASGKDYYAFEFYEALPLDTPITIRVEQREAYNGWTQTKIVDTVTFKDVFRFKDTVNARIVDPGSWNTRPGDEALFGIDITPSRLGNYDSENFDVMDFDSVINAKQIGYYRLLSIHEVLADSFSAAFSDKYQDRLGLLRADSISTSLTEKVKTSIKYNPKDTVSAYLVDGPTGLFDDFLFDTEIFDSINTVNIAIEKKGPTEKSTAKIAEVVSFKIVYADGSESTQAVYAPDEKGVVVVNPPADRVEILHNYGYNPLVAVYLNNTIMYPKTIRYVGVNSIVVEFTEPRSVVIRLA